MDNAIAQLAEWAALVQRLDQELKRLEPAASQAGIPGLNHREWHELLTRKLLPQLSSQAWLVVAVVGGTNIGKSVVFNHLAGGKISATSPLASGTRHPACLVPVNFPGRASLPEIFPGFHLSAWSSADETLQDSPEHRLFVREGAHTPPNLMVLDTPDIDSDARVNWERADHIRQSADVLIAVLTQQKYNDAAVKEFFRKAATEDKVVIVVFNQVLLPEDESYWPLWLHTFCEETGVRPHLVYLAPNDRRAADELRLPFYERPWPVDSMNGKHPEQVPEDTNRQNIIPESTWNDSPASSLMVELSRLKFDQIKLRTLHGSLRRLIDPLTGVPAYLHEIEQRSREFASAAELLSTHQLAAIDDWPTAPNIVMISELRQWWADQREGWSRNVHRFYNSIGTGLTWPIRYARSRLGGTQESPLESYRRQEWSTILAAVDKVFEKFEFLAELGNHLLKPRLATILSGASREELLETLRERHNRVDFHQELQTLVHSEMEKFREESPRYYEMFRRLDVIAAAVRPATSVVLFVTGFGAFAPVADTALQGALHVAGDVTGGAIVAAVGDSVLSGGASKGLGYFETKFRKLHAAFTATRAAWFGEVLQEKLLGTLPEQLHVSATIPQSDSFLAVRETLQRLQIQ